MKQPDDLNPYQSPASSSMGSDGDTEQIIVLASFDSSFEAHLFRNELIDNGIDARIANEASGSLGAAFGGTAIPFLVIVLKSQVDDALVIKEQWISKSTTNLNGPRFEWKCRCGETVDAGFAVCWNCQEEYLG